MRGPQVPPSAPPPVGYVRLTIQGDPVTVGPAPAVAVNGWPVQSRFGVQDIPVWAGRNRIDAHTTLFGGYGTAWAEVDVAPGQTIALWYAPPWHPLTTGRMGPTPQRRAGGWVAVICVAGVLLATVASCLAL